MRFHDLGLQLWSLVDDVERDLASTLETIRSLGFHTIELAGMHSHTREQMRDALRSAGLSVYAIHQPSLLRRE